MKVVGNFKCQKCKSVAEWEYIVPQRYGCKLEVELIDESKCHPISKRRLNEEEFLFVFRCKKCQEINEVIYLSRTMV